MKFRVRVSGCERLFGLVELFSSVQFIYLPLRITWREAKKKSNYLDSQGEEDQKKLAGL